MQDSLHTNSLRLPLLLLRLSIALVMIMWALDKLINPDHAAAVGAKFYFMGEQGATVFMVIGVVQLLIYAAFVAGAFKTLTYGAVLLMHAGSTLTTFGWYLDPFNHLLGFAAIPMLAGAYLLFAARRQDTLLAVH